MKVIRKVYYFWINDGKKEKKSVLWRYRKDAEASRKRYLKRGKGVSKIKSKLARIFKNSKYTLE